MRQDEERLLAADNLDALRIFFRENPNYQETIAELDVQINKSTYQTLYASGKLFVSRAESSIRTMFENMKTSEEEFQKQREAKEQADLTKDWDSIWAVIDAKEKFYKVVIGELLLSYEIQNKLLDKFYETLDAGYEKGWPEKVKAEHRKETLELSARVEELCRTLGISRKEEIENYEEKIKELDEKLRLAKMTEEDRRVEWFDGYFNEAIAEWIRLNNRNPNTRECLQIIPGDVNEKSLSLKRQTEKGMLTQFRKGKEITYAIKTPQVAIEETVINENP